MLKRVVISVIVTAGVGAAGCGSAVVKTVTERSVTPAATTRTQVRTVYRTPTACLELAHSGSQLTSIFGVLFKRMAPLPELVKEAAAAGLAQNDAKILSIGAKTRAINADIERAAKEVHDLDTSLREAPGSCS